MVVLLFMATLDELKKLAAMPQAVRRTTGFTGVEVHYLPQLEAYVKVGPASRVSDLLREADVLRWLGGRLGAPRVLDHAADGTEEALLISAVPGDTVEAMLTAAGNDVKLASDILRECAGALRRLHSISTVDCPFDMTLPERFRRAKRNVDLELVNETDEEFAAEHDGMYPRQVYEKLHTAMWPAEDDLVFTHGDPCMPNILLSGGEFNGFIDFDGAGVADRYIDIAVFTWSFQYNCRAKVDVLPIFSEVYGVELDRARLDFYGEIDHLF